MRLSPFHMGSHLPLFDGSDWATWAGTLEAILVLYEADDVITNDTCPCRYPCG